MSIGCIEAVVPIVEQIVKHESIIRKLLKSLQKCCSCQSSGSSDEEIKEEARAVLIETVTNELNELCDSKELWDSKDRRRWHKLANELFRLGAWTEEQKKLTPWKNLCVNKD
jgi:uncharacterized protein YPO0396